MRRKRYRHLHGRKENQTLRGINCEGPAWTLEGIARRRKKRGEGDSGETQERNFRGTGARQPFLRRKVTTQRKTSSKLMMLRDSLGGRKGGEKGVPGKSYSAALLQAPLNKEGGTEKVDSEEKIRVWGRPINVGCTSGKRREDLRGGETRIAFGHFKRVKRKGDKGGNRTRNKKKVTGLFVLLPRSLHQCHVGEDRGT